MKILQLTFCAFVLSCALVASAAPVVITNPGLSSESIDADTIKSVFRGKKLSWSNKSPVVVAVLKNGTVHEQFLKQAFNISPSSFANYWRLTSMSGGASAPKEFATEDELLQFVAATPGAVGYVDGAKVSPSVHAVPLN